ncbi:MAG: hypothetical protein H0X29_10280 [Parachlamydiaceae bacterium]|nr:hypothetical protein [Parachlamydiaceae bacterium]
MEDEKKLNDLNTVNYTFTLPSILYKRLENHLQELNRLQNPQKKKQTWLVNAIQEKIARDEHSDMISKANHLNLRLDENTLQKLEERMSKINRQKKLKYTKKQWILDAIEEKMEVEKELIQNKLLEHTLSKKMQYELELVVVDSPN